MRYEGACVLFTATAIIIFNLIILGELRWVSSTEKSAPPIASPSSAALLIAVA